MFTISHYLNYCYQPKGVPKKTLTIPNILSMSLESKEHDNIFSYNAKEDFLVTYFVVKKSLPLMISCKVCHV